MRVKICGVTSVADAQFVAQAGADAIGLNFFKPSSRYINIEQAYDIVQSVGPFLTVVGLFVDAEIEQIQKILKRVPLNCLQFHGDESPEFCQQFDRPYIKALRMRDNLDLEFQMSRYSSAQGILLDAYHPELPGGTGKTFDWGRVPKSTAHHIVLAGGLTPENVSNAINQTEVYGVDVSGGVEKRAGHKDPCKVKAFIDNSRCMKPIPSKPRVD